MTLRVRLTAALVVLVTLGLLVSDVATYAALRSYLIDRIDQQLRSSPRSVLFAMSQPDLPGAGPGPMGGDQMLPEGTYGVIVDASGDLVGDPIVFDYGGEAPSPPALPAGVRGGTVQEPTFLNLEAADGGSGYRAAAYRLTDGSTLVVAIPLTELSNTLRRFSFIAGAVTLVVLATMALLSLFTVRRGLRPLEQIEQTAEAIAAGDLSRRVDETDPRTEVGRLGCIAQRDARPDRGGHGRATRVGRGAPPVPGRCFARVAHSAHVDPWIRGALPTRGVGRPGRHGARDASHRAGG